MNLPPQAVHALLTLKNSLLAAQIQPLTETPEVKPRKAAREPKPTQLMRHARTPGSSWQNFRRRETGKVCR